MCLKNIQIRNIFDPNHAAFLRNRFQNPISITTRIRVSVAQSPFGPFGIERGSLQTNQPIQLLQIIHIINTMNIVSYRIMRVFCAIYASPNHHPAPRGITKKNKICTRFEKNYFKFSVCFAPCGSMRIDSSGRGGRSRFDSSGRGGRSNYTKKKV